MTIREVRAALTALLKQAAPGVPVSKSDTDKPVVRPSFKIDIFPAEGNAACGGARERSIDVDVWYYPAERVEYLEECSEMAERLIAALETGIDTGEIVLVPGRYGQHDHIARCAGAPVCTQLVRERRRNRRNDGSPRILRGGVKPMAITMPKIEISFEQRAVSLIGRSERGIAILIVRDDTDKSFTHKQYSDLSAAQADESLYTADNYNAICDLLGFAPYQAHVFRCDSDGALADTLTEISKTVKTGWLTIAGQSAADGLALAVWVKTQDNTKKKTYKAVCYDLTTLAG